MAGTTDHYGFQTLQSGESFSLNGYKFTDADRQLLDRLLYIGAEGHHHTGQEATNSNPAVPPTLAVAAGGTLPAGTRVYYKYTYVDVFGNESASSPESFVDTAAQLPDPAAPTPVVATTGGILLAGNYYYALSAYTTTTTAETQATNPAYITIPSGTNTNTVTLTLPTLPGGASGFNVYRKRPGASKYFYLYTTTPLETEFLDDGTVPEDCDRTLPAANTTNATNQVTITLPAAVPVGFTWKLYRTFVNGDYSRSLVHHVVEETAEGSGIIVDSYLDLGAPTEIGQPPVQSQFISTPNKVLLTSGAEVQGTLPLARSVHHPYVLTFSFNGQLGTMMGTTTWVCPFPTARIAFVRANLGRGYSPAAADVIVDVNKGSGLNPTYVTVFTTQGNRPKVLVGNQIGSETIPDVVTMVRGDSLTVDIDQAGGGAGTDRDLTVTIAILAQFTNGSSDNAWI